MQYTITCPSCKQTLTVNPGWEGRQVNCPLCSSLFVMPSGPSAVNAVGAGKRSWLNSFGVFFACFALLYNLSGLFNLTSNTTNTTSTNHSDPYRQAIKMYELSPEEGLKEAKRFMVGTWTYTGMRYKTKNSFMSYAEHPGVNTWMKWVVKEDGTMIKYKVKPTADDWGNGKEVRWGIEAGKFADTGLRYYEFVSDSFDIFDAESNVVITREGKLEYRLENKISIFLERGDVFPFSK